MTSTQGQQHVLVTLRKADVTQTKFQLSPHLTTMTSLRCLLFHTLATSSFQPCWCDHRSGPTLAPSCSSQPFGFWSCSPPNSAPSWRAASPSFPARVLSQLSELTPRMSNILTRPQATPDFVLHSPGWILRGLKRFLQSHSSASAVRHGHFFWNAWNWIWGS